MVHSNSQSLGAIDEESDEGNSVRNSRPSDPQLQGSPARVDYPVMQERSPEQKSDQAQSNQDDEIIEEDKENFDQPNLPQEEEEKVVPDNSEQLK